MARILIEGSPEELIGESNYLKAQVADFFSDLSPMAKSQGQTIKPHSCPAMNHMVRSWIDEYEAAMGRMNADIGAFLAKIVAGEHPEGVKNESA